MRNEEDILEISNINTFDILFEDEYYIAIYKPAKLLVHRSSIDRHETQFVLQILRDQIGQYIYPIHRLDKPTSGVLLFAKSSDAAHLCQQLIQQQAITKEYLAIVRGHPTSCFISHSVKAQKDKYHQKELLPDSIKKAETTLQLLATTEIDNRIDARYPCSRYALVALQPHTGRRHQLRYHMKHIASPIIGDPKYGKAPHNRYFAAQLNYNRLYLTASLLMFIHPFTQNKITIKGQADHHFQQAATLCGFNSVLNHYFEHDQPVIRPKDASLIHHKHNKIQAS